VAINTYETLFILDSNTYARDPGGISAHIASLVTDAGGNVLVNRLWMEQKLAYTIGHHQKGTYWLCYFELESTSLPKLARSFKLFDAVVREMTLRLEPRLVEPVLANARGESILPSSTADGYVDSDVDEAIEDEEEPIDI
jgi:small subunit ribosomal protein S6